MKFKLAVGLGISSWILIKIIMFILNNFIHNDFIPYFNIFIPLSIILATLLSGIYYIREINENEIKESFFMGIVFFLVNCFLDLIVILYFVQDFSMEYLLSKFISLIILIPLTAVSLGYLAQMKIELT